MNGDLGPLFENIFAIIMLSALALAVTLGIITTIVVMIKSANDWSNAEFAYHQRKWRYERKLKRATRQKDSARVETIQGMLAELDEKPRQRKPRSYDY